MYVISCTVGVPNRKFLNDCIPEKTVFFFFGWGESVTMAACYKPITCSPCDARMMRIGGVIIAKGKLK